MSWVKFGLHNDIDIDRNWFSPIEMKFSEDVVVKYLNLISLSRERLREYLGNHSRKIRNIELQLKEQTPLTKYPLLKVGESFFCYSPKVFNEHMRNFIYDLLKNKDPAEFSQHFGVVVESYLRLGLEHSGLHFLEEKKLKRLLGNSKVVDFLICESECSVLVESKAIEMSPLARVNPSDMVLSNALSDSVIKAVKQIYSVADSVQHVSDPRIINTDNLFALVVTYKDLYLGTGEDAWKEIIGDELSRFLETNSIDGNLLPPSRIFYLSVHEFDRMVQVVRKKRINLATLLDKIAIDNMNPETKKYSFEMHLRKDQAWNAPLPYLDEPFNKIFEEIELALRTKNLD